MPSVHAPHDSVLRHRALAMKTLRVPLTGDPRLITDPTDAVRAVAAIRDPLVVRAVLVGVAGCGADRVRVHHRPILVGHLGAGEVGDALGGGVAGQAELTGIAAALAVGQAGVRDAAALGTLFVRAAGQTALAVAGAVFE